jgi:hypothetical protein
MGSGWRVLRTTLPLSVVLGRAGAVGAVGAAGGASAAGAAGSGCSGSGVAISAAGASSAGAAAFFVAFFALVAFAGSSGWTSRRRPSRSALRRARSAWASSMLELWLFTPIPRESARSSISLFVRPSSLASSCTRIFFCGNCPTSLSLRHQAHSLSSSHVLLERLTQERQRLSTHRTFQGPAESLPLHCGVETFDASRAQPGAAPRCRPADDDVAINGADDPHQLRLRRDAPTADTGAIRFRRGGRSGKCYAGFSPGTSGSAAASGLAASWSSAAASAVSPSAATSPSAAPSSSSAGASSLPSPSS